MTPLLGFILTMCILSSLDSEKTASSLEGNWLLSAAMSPTLESTVALIKLESKNGALAAQVVASAPLWAVTRVDGFSRDGKTVRFVLTGSAEERTFEGKISPMDNKIILGSFGNERQLHLSRMARTDLSELAKDGLMAPHALPEPMRKLQSLASRVEELRIQRFKTKEVAEKAQIARQIASADQEILSEAPKLYQEVITHHAGHRAAFEAALNLLRSATRDHATSNQVESWAQASALAAEPYGRRWQQEVALQICESLQSQSSYRASVLKYARQAAEFLTPHDSVTRQVRILKILTGALEKNNQVDEARLTLSRLGKLEMVLDGEYRTQFPDLEVAPFAAREVKNNRVVVLELFTGIHCPFCAAAYLVFDALRKSYPGNELVLVQYHLHLSGPDPLANADAEARWAYYAKSFPAEVRYTPATFINGRFQVLGGGHSSQKQFDLYRDAKKKYNLVSETIDRQAETPSTAKVESRVERKKNSIAIHVAVRDLAEPGESKRLRLVLVEEAVRLVGGNSLRFHCHVARAMPGGPEGILLLTKDSEHKAEVNLDNLRGERLKDLDDLGTRSTPIPTSDRPLDFKKLRLIAFVQDDKTKEVLQACQVGVPDREMGK